MRDVCPYAQPIRRKIVISYPTLQIACEQRRGGRLGSRQPQKIAAAQLHLRAEEIVIGGKGDWRVEDYTDQDLLSGHGTFAAGKLGPDLD